MQCAEPACETGLPRNQNRCLFRSRNVAIFSDNEPGSAKGEVLIHVVGDEPMLLELAKAILEPNGFRVAGFRSGEAALAAFGTATPKPRLVITDFAMGPIGRMNGLELIEACRRIVPNQKTMLLSGTVDESVCHTAQSKPDMFIGKPYEPAQLLRVVRRLTGVGV